MTRRSALKVLGGGVLGSALMPYLPGVQSAAAAPTDFVTGLKNNVDHIVVFMQENRSFDHYFGLYPGADGLPDCVALPDATGTFYGPFHETAMCTLDQTHGFDEIHGQWNDGAMDGFVRFGGPQTLAYYTGDEIGFYWALASRFTLCDRYFGSFLGGTFANRLYSYCASNGTKPGWPGVLNNPATVNDEQSQQLAGVPTILDRMGLPEDGPLTVTWKVYGLGGIAGGSRPDPIESDNPLTFFPQYQPDVRPLTFQRISADLTELELDLATGQLPQVSWIIPEIGLSEHPPFPISTGMSSVAATLKLLMESSAWERTIVIFSYDEAGGYYDHVPPPIIETKTVDGASQGVEPGTYAYGRGFRVPAMVLSPFARPGAIVSDVYDHTSALALIEARFDIEPLTALDAAADPFIACLDFSAPQPALTIEVPDPGVGLADCAVFAPQAVADSAGVPIPIARTYTASAACPGVVAGEGNPAPLVARTGNDATTPLLAAGALTAAALAARRVSRPICSSKE
ncbi:MAG: phospholipase [Acidimicrobiaceae bacterium]|jgi:phospholipase C